jgi:ferredoxin-NADP reductase/uncharacterized protein YcbX
MSSPRLSAIYRFPVKGFPAQSLEHADVNTHDGGIPMDRFLAVSNGEGSVSSTDWSPCQYFVRMTKNEGLPLFSVALEENDGELRMTSPAGDSLTAKYNDDMALRSVSDTLNKWFTAKGGASPHLHRRRNNLGWWDHRDATISIINNVTVASLSYVHHLAIDAMRFRGNLYLDGLTAWEEFAWIGRRIRIGNVELEILRPIDRCSATSVNPVSSNKDVNVPALIAKKFGHVFCGVYARVVSSGTLRVNDDVTVPERSNVSLTDIATVDTAPPPAQWPRIARVVARAQESADVTSFWLQDPLRKWVSSAKPGQHIRVHAPESGLLSPWRSYTISGVTHDQLRISVKREAHQNSFSDWLCKQIQQGSEVAISGPYGSFTLETHDERPIALISAGIGITPMLSMLRSLSASDISAKDIYVWHAARNAEHAALWQELHDAAQNTSAKLCQLYLSQPQQGDLQRLNALPGRIDVNALDALPFHNARIYVCGPADFVELIRAIAMSRGMTPDSFHSERFASPSSIDQTARAVPRAGPFKVTFSRTKQSVEWSSSQGTLLELGEQHGVRLSANCRAAACGACKVALLGGRVFHLVKPPFPLADNELLTCCAVPMSDVEIEA